MRALVYSVKVPRTECGADLSYRKRLRKERETRHEHRRQRNLLWPNMDRDIIEWLFEIGNLTES